MANIEYTRARGCATDHKGIGLALLTRDVPETRQRGSKTAELPLTLPTLPMLLLSVDGLVHGILLTLSFLGCSCSPILEVAQNRDPLSGGCGVRITAARDIVVANAGHVGGDALRGARHDVLARLAFHLHLRLLRMLLDYGDVSEQPSSTGRLLLSC